MIKKLLFILSFFLVTASSFAIKYVAVQNGAWTDPNTWGASNYPQDNDTAVIPAGITVEIQPQIINFWIIKLKVGRTINVQKVIVNENGVLQLTNGELSIFGYDKITKLYVADTLKIDGRIEGDITSGYYPRVYLGNVLTGTGTSKNIRYYTNTTKVIIPAEANLIFYTSTFLLQNSDTVENYGKLYSDQWILGESATCTWINKANSQVSVGDRFMFGSKLISNEPNNTVIYAPIWGKVQVTIPVDSTYYNLYFSGSDTSIVDTSVLYVENDLNIQSSVLHAHKSIIYVRGNWVDNGSFLADTATVIFDGSKSQSISASAFETFFNLELKNSPDTIYLYSDVHVNDTLTLATTINNQGKVLVLGVDASNPGVLEYNQGKVIGEMKRWAGATNTALFYPIGSRNFNTFVNINLSGVGTSGLLGFKFVEEFPGSKGLPLIDNGGDTVYNVFGDGYWVCDTSDGFKLGSNTYNIVLQGDKFNSFDITDSTKIVVRPAVDSSWRFDGVKGTNDIAQYKVARNNLDTLPWQFAFADTTNCSPPLLTSINGDVNVCRGSQNVLYNTDTSSTNTFYWVVNGGTIAQNKGDTVYVNWEDNGQYGQISVYAQNSCSFGNTVSLTVSIHSIPPAQINGMLSVPEQSDSVLYTIDPLNNYTYDYYVSSTAELDSVYPTEDSILVSFSTPGYDTIYVVASYNGGCKSDTAFFPIYVYDVINSVKTGSWYDPTTWDCSCYPLKSDNVRIKSGHTVTVDQQVDPRTLLPLSNYDVNNLIVEKGGILSRSNANLYIHGDIINNGTIDFSNNYLDLFDPNKVIDGLGTFIVDTIRIFGTRTINATANLNIQGNINVESNKLQNIGKIIVSGDIKGETGGTYVNDKNALLAIKGQLMNTGGELIADSTGNTVYYSGKDQQVTPVSSASAGYYNLILGGNGTKTASGDLTVLGSFSITDTAVFDLQNHNITLYGNWYEYSIASDPFLEGTSLVLFNANTDQYIYAENGETFYDLKVGQNSTLHAMPNQHFTVSNNLYIDGLLKLEMNKYNDTLPSLIYNNDIIYGTNGRVETDLYLNSKHWHEISPAITGLNSGLFTRITNNRFNPNLYWYQESVDLDGNTSTPPADPFDNSYLSQGWQYAHNGNSGADIDLKLNAGYLYYIDQDTVFQMTGKVAKVSINYDTTLSYTSNDPISDTLPNFYDGWNLVGNPYTAYLDIDTVLKYSTNVDNGVFIWDDANGQYAGYKNGYRIQSGTLGNLIPPLQAFFVRANNTGAVLALRPQYRTHGKQQYLKAYSPNKYKQNAIKLGLTAAGKTEYFAAYFYPQAKLNYNAQYDLLHLKSGNNANPQLFSKKGSINLSLLALPDSTMDNAVIPIYIYSPSGTDTLTIAFINGLNNHFVLLRDNLDNQLFNLRDKDKIVFNYSDGEDPHRFDLLFVKDNPPVITDTIPDLVAYEDSSFSIKLNNYFADKDLFDTIKIKIENLPQWISFDGQTLSGTPTQENVGKYELTVAAYDIFNQKTTQSVTLTVINTNDPPKANLVLEPVITMANDQFSYTLPDNLFTDPDPNDKLTITASNLPEWLSYNATTRTFSGLPTIQDAGTYNIQITATDLAGTSASTTLTIKVETKAQLQDKPVNIYPVPATKELNILIARPTQKDIIRIYDTNGKLHKQINANDDLVHINISDLQPGQYIVEVVNGQDIYKIKITKY